MSFGNYQLLHRLMRGEPVSHLSSVPSNLVEAGYAVLVKTHLEITQLGVLAAKGPCPPFPKLGRVAEPICFRCGFPQPLTLCVGDCA